MLPKTVMALHKLDGLRTQRANLNRAISETQAEIRERRALADLLGLARDALAERFNAARDEMAGQAEAVPSGSSEPTVAGPGGAADLARLVPPPIRKRDRLAALVLHVPGREPVRVEFPDRRLAEAEKVLLGFGLIARAQPGDPGSTPIESVNRARERRGLEPVGAV